MARLDFPEELLNRLAQAERIAVLTGAGVSAESGVKTFRDTDGLWQKFSPQELASMDGFLANPQLVWEWYKQRRDVINTVQPNPGHTALAELEGMYRHFTLSTQNVDRLHQRAGSKNVLELHGNIVDNYCVECRLAFRFDNEEEEPSTIPQCTRCGGLIRPAVVWFGEMLPVDTLRKSQAAAEGADVYFSIGTTAEVTPAGDLPRAAALYGAYTVEINPNPTIISHIMDCTIQAPAGVALPQLLEALHRHKQA